MGLDTKFMFLGWPKAKILAIQFLEDFDGGHFEKCPKRWGRPNLYGVNISIIDQWGPLNKMIPLMEDPGGGGARWPLCAHGLHKIRYILDMITAYLLISLHVLYTWFWCLNVYVIALFLLFVSYLYGIMDIQLSVQYKDWYGFKYQTL